VRRPVYYPGQSKGPQRGYGNGYGRAIGSTETIGIQGEGLYTMIYFNDADEVYN
jgi:hypothetical protein